MSGRSLQMREGYDQAAVHLPDLGWVSFDAGGEMRARLVEDLSLFLRLGLEFIHDFHHRAASMVSRLSSAWRRSALVSFNMLSTRSSMFPADV